MNSFRWLATSALDVDAYFLKNGQWFLFVISRKGLTKSELIKIAENFPHGEVAIVAGAAKANTSAKSEPVEPVAFAEKEELVAIEGETHYALEAEAVLNPGLFLDQSKNRNFLKMNCLKGQTLLNLFCYTSSFSVVAAKQGVVTTSVDVSARYLKWSQKNFALNELQTGGHRFLKADARDFVRREAAKKRKFDWVIVDPPTFSRADGKVFQIEKHLEPLLCDVLKSWTEKGGVLVSTNDASWDEADFEGCLRRATNENHRLRRIEIPTEFGTHYPLKGFWILPRASGRQA